MSISDANPLERDHLREVAKYLDSRGCLWFHPFNEGKRPPWVGAFMKKLGLKKGCPDVLVFEHWTELLTAPVDVPVYGAHFGFGMAVELKRIGGDKPSPEQTLWLARMARRGMKTLVSEGHLPALRFFDRHLKPFGDRW